MAAEAEEQTVKATAEGLGIVCCSCGLCFLHGKHRYAAYEYLPQGLPYEEATFLVCRDCGTAHALEHAASEESELPDRLRARKGGPVFIPISPSIRRRYRRVIAKFQERRKWLANPLSKVELRHPQRNINLLPPHPWKQRRAEWWAPHKEKFIDASITVLFWCSLPIILPYLLFDTIQEALWAKRHPLEWWQRREPIWVTSPETYEQRLSQLTRLQDNYEALWPVIAEIPTPEKTDEEVMLDADDEEKKSATYVRLSCAHCGTTGSLVENVTIAADFPYHYGSVYGCPACKREAMMADNLSSTYTYLEIDDRNDRDTSLYLLGDVLYHGGEWRRRHEWLERFSSYEPPRSETGIFRFDNGLLKAHLLTTSQGRQLWVPPGRTFEVHIKSLENEDEAPDPHLAYWYMYEIVAVYDGVVTIYRAGEL